MSIKILLVVDSPTERLAIKNIFQHEYCVLTAHNSSEAMLIIDAHSDIDLLILDLTMPDNDSIQVLEALNRDKKGRNLRTIILTKHDEIDKEIEGLRLGADDYIRKPLHMNSLKVRIDTHIQLLKVQRLYQHELHENSLKYEGIFQKAPVGIAISFLRKPLSNFDKKLTSINPMYEKITGRTKEELLKLGWSAITHPEDSIEEQKKFNQLKSGEINGYSMEKRYIRPDGSIVWVDMVVARLDSEPDADFNHICIIQDITNRKAIEQVLLESERSKSVLLASLPGLAYRCKYDRDWTMQFVSEGSYDLTGYKAESFINNRDLSYNELIAPEYREFLWLEWKKKLARRLPFQYEYEIITKTGQRKWVLEVGQGIFDEHGNVEALEGIVLDITDRKDLELKQQYMLEHNTLTGLYNRSYFEGLLINDLRTMINRKRALFSVNLSKVDLLTLTYGFSYSQALIKKTANALSTLCTGNCQLFSTYNNLLTFYMHDYHDKSELIEFYHEIEKILSSILMVEGIGAGVGILELDNESDVKEIQKNLLIASEHALNNPNQRYSYAFFDKKMELKLLRQKKVKDTLERIAAGEDLIYIEYQPIFDVKNNKVFIFEALARIRTEELGVISPLEFIPLAEETKLIVPVGKMIIRKILNFLIKLKAAGKESVNISMNVSGVQLLTDNFTSDLFELLKTKCIAPEKLIIEITESIFSDKFGKLNKTLEELKSSGVEIAIDDFGTGYSSFARSQELDVNYLKIDKYFIDKLRYIKPEQAIAGDIISMAHKLGHYVVAEGVEHEVQMQYLNEHGCDLVQGYLISKPMDEDEAIEFLKMM